MSIVWNEKNQNEPAFAGAVLGETSKVLQLMSDVYADAYYAIVWNEAKQAVEHINVGNAEFGVSARIIPDAGPVEVAKAAAFFQAEELARLKRERAATIARAIEDARRPAKGKDVVVARGRK